jgi:hypothetical protein
MRRQDFVRQRVKRLTEVAQCYEAEREAAIDRSGLPDARCRMFQAYQEVDGIARDVAEIEPRTLAGAAIMARVLCAYSETGPSAKTSTGEL